jgi:hypothetical protein
MNRVGISRMALEDLWSMNQVFVALMQSHAAARPGTGAGHFGLAPGLMARLARLDAAERAGIGRCPFALCSFGFQDLELWQRLLGRKVSEPANREHWPGQASRRRQFTVMALGLVRSLAAREPHAADLFFGLPADFGAAFADFDLAQLPRLAGQAEVHLRARLGDHPRFWSELLAAASSGSAARCRAIRDLGLQLTLQRALRIEGAKPRCGVLCRAF